MEKSLAVLNQMEQEGVISRYAIGGAIAATFYVEPVQTFDLDVFILFPSPPSGLISASPIFDYLIVRGYTAEREMINIEGWPVQFLPVYNSLTDEALAQATDVTFGSTPTRVLTAEHLAAIMLDTGRPKDHARLLQFLEVGVVNKDKLSTILSKHRLEDKWKHFVKRYLDDTP